MRRLSEREFVVAGELDGSTTEQFDASLTEARDVEGVVVVDLSGLTFLDSLGIQCLIRLGMSRSPNGLILRHPTARVARVLALRGLDRASLWTIERTER
ncbi:MAG TPA: STAS domain-containing protein [Actinomycetota bacterium]